MTQQPPIQSLVPGGKPVELVAYYGAIKILKSIDPQHAVVMHHNGARVTVLPGGSQIEVLTGEPPWTYSVAFPMRAELEPDPDLRILIDLEVLKGRIGVGCLSKDGQYIGSERQIGPGRRRTVLLPVSDPTNLAEVMLRNGPTRNGRSTARVYGIKVGRLIDRAAAAETELSVETLARRVHEAVNSEGRNEGFRPAVSDGAIEVVGYDQLGAALGFAETFVQPPGAGEGLLAFWRMERDDAPIFRYIYRNLKPKRHLEYGTWEGFGVVVCAESCDADIWTLNLPDGEKSVDGGAVYGHPSENGLVQTDAGQFIGRLYREAGYTPRVHQVLCDSTKWRYEGIGPGFFDSVLIDGGHTYDVVTADTDKTIPLVRSGGIVMWHDFCPEEEALQVNAAPRGVVEAVARNHHRWREYFTRILWVRPSWVLVGIRN